VQTDPTDEALAQTYLRDLRTMLEKVDAAAVAAAVGLLARAHDDHRTIFICGNGGSAATASHMACDLAKNTCAPDRRRLRVIGLCDNVAWLSALANDRGYESVFVEQMSNLLEPHDVLIAISASGDSPNVVRAAEFARSHGARVVGLTGFGGGKLKTLSDVCVVLDSNCYGLVEDGHLAINHIFTEALRRRLARSS
jgi:D-sedoheptulose 7-phosphate isomerase